MHGPTCIFSANLTPSFLATVAARQKFYLILSCQSHLGVATGDDYLMLVKGVRAFAPPSQSSPVSV
jgi:hypothetical protein